VFPYDEDETGDSGIEPTLPPGAPGLFRLKLGFAMLDRPRAHKADPILFFFLFSFRRRLLSLVLEVKRNNLLIFFYGFIFFKNIINFVF